MMQDCDSALRADDLPLPEATRVRLAEAALRWVEAQEFPIKSLPEAARNLTARLEGLGGAAGRPVSAKTLERMLYAWRKAGRAWQALVDKRTLAPARCGVRTANRAFRAHLALLAGRHPRSLMSAIKELYAEWREGKAIPGYEGANCLPNMPLPQGWSADNLMRCMPDKGALRVLHEGVRAGYNDLAQVFSTRAGGWPGCMVSFDDGWLDCLAHGYDAQGRLCLGRPLQLGCLDRYTGKRLSWFTKLRTKGEDGKSLQLNGDEMLFLLCHYLFNVGYSRRGTALVCEHGTAAIGKEAEEMLSIISGGLIRVERSGMTGLRQAGAFGGRGVGNPRFKAELESWHNLLHNRMDGVLTQTGKNRTEPERLWGVRVHEEKLLAAQGALPPERALALAPFSMSLAQLGDFLVQVVGGINARTDHGLEGWEECGFMEPEFSFNGRTDWQLISAMAGEEAQEARALIERKPSRMRLRRLSPNEAWLRSLALPGNGLVRFTPAECVALMGAHRKFKLHQKGGCFLIDSRSRHHRQLLFKTEVSDGCGHWRPLPSSGTFYGVLNPFSEELFVLDEKERVLGAAPICHRAAHVDEAARLRMFGDVVRRRAEELARIENLVAPDAAAQAAQLDYNMRVLAGKAADPLGAHDEKLISRMAARSKGAAAEPFAPPALPDGLGLADDYEGSAFND